MRTVGILGVMGPETVARFYLQINARARARNSTQYPPIILYSVPVPYDLEREIVESGRNEEQILPFLVRGLQSLEAAGVEVIAIPCNTVHCFMPELRECVDLPILSIVEETADVCTRADYRTVGVLATTETVKHVLYEQELARYGIQVVTPDMTEQQLVSAIIQQILDGNKSIENKQALLKVIRTLQSKGAEAVILGCTALELVLQQSDSSVPLLDSFEILVVATVRELLR
ncbi:MAG: amino acid racemase [Methanomicrobia archaeon]|nr:amino acid racemase [Methanomicrobia archaeon]